MISCISAWYIFNDTILHLAFETLENLRIKKSGEVEFIVVDDGSNRKGAKYLKSRADIYLRNETNLGCGVAWNMGLERVSFPHILMATDMQFLTEGWDARLVRDFESQKGIGFLLPSHIEDFKTEYKPQDRILPVSIMYAYSAAIFSRKDIYEQLGKWEEDTGPCGYIDKDMWIRARLAGLSLMTTLAVWLFHKTKRTLSQMPEFQKTQVQTNDSFRRKWGHLSDEFLYGV